MSSGGIAQAAELPCANPAGKPWCDTSLTPDQRADLIVAAMTEGEKIRMLLSKLDIDQSHIPGVPRLGIPYVEFVDGGLGVAHGGGSTALPSGPSLAATFDRDLARQAGEIIGVETRAKGHLQLFGPMVNMARVPQAGRNFETFGEDPLLTSRLSSEWIKGLQSKRVYSQVKVFVGNEQEGVGVNSPDWFIGLSLRGNRYWQNSVIDERTLREIYFAPFESAVKDANVASIMCSYNRVNGPKSCANGRYMRDMIRGEWGFRGFIQSDGIIGTFPWLTTQHFNATLDHDGAPPLAYAPWVLRDGLRKGRLSYTELDNKVRRMLRTSIAYDLLEDPPVAAKDFASAVDIDGHDRIAERMAGDGAVLLTNNGVLPLDPARRQTIAVIGQQADKYVYGGGSSRVRGPARPTTLLKSIGARVSPNTTVLYDSGRDRARAARLAKRADVAIVAAATYESEGADRRCLALKCDIYGDQDGLIRSVAAAQSRTIVVVQSGGAILTPWRSQVAAILNGWYPGQAGGRALAAILFGDREAGGRLPLTFPAEEKETPVGASTAQYPGTRGDNVYYREGVLIGYRWWDHERKAPAFPFGHGLSYTTFAYENLQVVPSANGRGLQASVVVRNTGQRRGSDVAQLYLGLTAPEPGAVMPPSQLKDFGRVNLAPGESTTVRFSVDERGLSSWSLPRAMWTLTPGCVNVMVGRSSRDLPLRARVPVAGGQCPA